MAAEGSQGKCPREACRSRVALCELGRRSGRKHVWLHPDLGPPGREEINVYGSQATPPVVLCYSSSNGLDRALQRHRTNSICFKELALETRGPARGNLREDVTSPLSVTPAVWGLRQGVRVPSLGRIPPSQRKLSLLLRPSPEWVRPAHIGRGIRGTQRLWFTRLSRPQGPALPRLD